MLFVGKRGEALSLIVNVTYSIKVDVSMIVISRFSKVILFQYLAWKIKNQLKGARIFIQISYHLIDYCEKFDDGLSPMKSFSDGIRT